MAQCVLSSTFLDFLSLSLSQDFQYTPAMWREFFAFGELCKYGFNSSGIGHSYPWNKKTSHLFRMNYSELAPLYLPSFFIAIFFLFLFTFIVNKVFLMVKKSTLASWLLQSLQKILTHFRNESNLLLEKIYPFPFHPKGRVFPLGSAHRHSRIWRKCANPMYTYTFGTNVCSKMRDMWQMAMW